MIIPTASWSFAIWRLSHAHIWHDSHDFFGITGTVLLIPKGFFSGLSWGIDQRCTSQRKLTWKTAVKTLVVVGCWSTFGWMAFQMPPATSVAVFENSALIAWFTVKCVPLSHCRCINGCFKNFLKTDAVGVDLLPVVIVSYYYTLLRHKAAINNKKHTDIYNAT